VSEPVRILIVEDVATDAELAEREIRQALGSCVFQRVETRPAYLAALETFQPDLIISDYRMPHFDGLTALKLALERVPLTPLIILTGSVNEDTAVECMKTGATDYVIKESIKRLGQAVLRALEQKELRFERRRAQEALRESEERYRTLAEAAKDFIFIINPDDTFQYVNHSGAQFLGLQPQDLIGRSRSDFFPPAIAAQQRRHIQKVFETGEPGFDEIAIPTSQGEAWLNTSLVPLRDKEGRVSAVLGIARDITERRQAEEAQAKLEEQLRQAQKMESIGRLAGGVAHDFNNHLTVIQGHCELMQVRMSDTDPVFQELEQIRRAGERAATLTQQLLAFSRKQMLAPVVLDLNSLVANLSEMLQRLIGEDVTLATALQPELWSVTADPGQIEQVIMNLALNARDAMLDGGRLTIETRNVHLDEAYAKTHPGAPVGPCVMLAVSDTGYGMNEATLARIFEPFFTTKEPGKGTGLGLATVYGIIKQSGGDILVYSELGQGTTFKIYLPARGIDAAGTLASQTQPAMPRGHETILLVEDEDMVRDLVRTVLQGSGYTILEARQGGEALSLAGQHQGAIDLLVTDLVMPHMSGRELAERLKALRLDLKVLFMSGYTDDVVVRHGLVAADVEFLPKPFSPGVLASKVRKTLDQVKPSSNSRAVRPKS
jgi:two-component system cell cycle sensor histidine kinase/response regulator CckA